MNPYNFETEYTEPEQTGLEIVADFDYEAPECFVPRDWVINNKYEWGEPDGKIRGDCARGSSKEGKPKCLPRSKAHSLGKKGRASAAARKRRQDPDAERSGKAKNVATK